MTKTKAKTKAKTITEALELALHILDRDSIRPLYGKAFNQAEVKILQEALWMSRPHKIPPAPNWRP